ncbi:MAG: hypothetical protein QOF50_440, partial [Gaiellaceae bacterium]|nr:hypothetical protein [Gaiellaceae bacterium]
MRTGKIAFMFPGQGALEAGMGKDIADAVDLHRLRHRLGDV